LPASYLFLARQQELPSYLALAFASTVFLLVSNEAMLQSVSWSNEGAKYSNEVTMSINYLTLLCPI